MNKQNYCSNQLGERPFGTAHWSGLYNDFPAFLLSWYGGAAIHYFNGFTWKQKTFNNLADAYEKLGIK